MRDFYTLISILGSILGFLLFVGYFTYEYFKDDDDLDEEKNKKGKK